MASSFTTTLFTIPGKGGWTFAPIPEQHAPEVAGPWGRTPVVATVDGVTWSTSAWLDAAAAPSADEANSWPKKLAM